MTGAKKEEEEKKTSGARITYQRQLITLHEESGSWYAKGSHATYGINCFETVGRREPRVVQALGEFDFSTLSPSFCHCRFGFANCCNLQLSRFVPEPCHLWASKSQVRIPSRAASGCGSLVASDPTISRSSRISLMSVTYMAQVVDFWSRTLPRTSTLWSPSVAEILHVRDAPRHMPYNHIEVSKSIPRARSSFFDTSRIFVLVSVTLCMLSSYHMEGKRQCGTFPGGGPAQ
jgi:hypothetical protein